jgi:type IV fimbrial biogenesis protein FimT
MKSQHGLTLIELLIAMSIAAILFGIAAPALSGAIASGRAAGVRADLLASLATAGTRSGTSGTRVVLCPTIDAENCSDDTDWSQGWLVFMDPNANRELDGGERLLHLQPPLPGHVHLRSTEGRTRIVYQANGVNVGSNVTFTLCDGRGPSRAISLVIANFGRLRDGIPGPEAVAATCEP